MNVNRRGFLAGVAGLLAALRVPMLASTMAPAEAASAPAIAGCGWDAFVAGIKESRLSVNLASAGDLSALDAHLWAAFTHPPIAEAMRRWEEDFLAITGPVERSVA